MSVEQILRAFEESISKSIRLLPEGTDRYQVFTPFHFGDGDHFVVVLKKVAGRGWILTDEGHTYMHLSYDMNLSGLARGNRNEIIEGTLDRYEIIEQAGQLIKVIDSHLYAGNYLYNFIQCLVHISDISYLSQDRVASTFMDDFKDFIATAIPQDRYQFNYRNPEHDSDGLYIVNCRVNSMDLPINIYAIDGNADCRDATIGILKFEEWEIPFQALGIFKDRDKIAQEVLARFTEACRHQFPRINGNEERIKSHLQERMG